MRRWNMKGRQLRSECCATGSRQLDGSSSAESFLHVPEVAAAQQSLEAAVAVAKAHRSPTPVREGGRHPTVGGDQPQAKTVKKDSKGGAHGVGLSGVPEGLHPAACLGVAEARPLSQQWP